MNNIKISGPVFFKQYKVKNSVINFFADTHLKNYKGRCIDAETHPNHISVTKLLANIYKKEDIKLLVECYIDYDYSTKDYMVDLCKYNVLKLDIRLYHDKSKKKRYYANFITIYTMLIKAIKEKIHYDENIMKVNLKNGIEINKENLKYLKSIIQHKFYMTKLNELIKESKKLSDATVLKYIKEVEINSEILNVYAFDKLYNLIKKNEKTIFIYMGKNHTNRLIEMLNKKFKEMSLTSQSFNENSRCITISNLKQITNLSLQQVRANIGGKKKNEERKMIKLPKNFKFPDIDLPIF